MSTAAVLGALLLSAIVLLGVLAGSQKAEAQSRDRAVTISVGGGHACALLDSGTVECWGDNRYGQTDAPSGRFSAVSAGWSHTCGLRETSEIESWGNNEYDRQARRQVNTAPSGQVGCSAAGWARRA